MSSDARDAAAAAVTAQVLAHLARHPRAGDTASGVRQCWLDASDAHDLGIVTEALDALVERGVLAQRELANHDRVYFAPPQVDDHEDGHA